VRTAENCGCDLQSAYPLYFVSTVAIPVPVRVEDPDGDPAMITLQTAAPQPFQRIPPVCLPGWCYPRANGDPYGTVSGLALATAGAGVVASARVSITATCSFTGLACAPFSPF
jgi:hypothetical protein